MTGFISGSDLQPTIINMSIMLIQMIFAISVPLDLFHFEKQGDPGGIEYL
jgi:hypothetical protein